MSINGTDMFTFYVSRYHSTDIGFETVEHEIRKKYQDDYWIFVKKINDGFFSYGKYEFTFTTKKLSAKL